LVAIGVIALLLYVPALLWKATAARDWPKLTSQRRRTAAVAAICACTLFSSVITILYSVHIPEIGDCFSISRLYTQPQSPQHVIAVARVLHTSMAFGTVAVVEDHYWGLPWWNRKVVFFRPVPFWKGKTLFIDGRRDDGLLSRFIPVLHFPCDTRT